MERLIQEIEEHIRDMFRDEGSGHDIYHLKRVLNLALTIQKAEGGDRVVIAASALLHDIHRIIQNRTGTLCSPKDSLPQVKEILDKTTLSDRQKDNILHCIEFHEEYDFSKNGKTVRDIETLILQDADNLDAIGAIGIGRTFAYTGAHAIPMWIPELPLFNQEYDDLKNDPSAIHHFHTRLLKLKDNMNTDTAKRMAEERHRFVKTFLQEFLDEWKGKK